MRIAPPVLAAAAFAVASTAHAQYSVQSLNAMNNQFNARLNAQMNQRTNGIIDQNMNDPRIVALWRQNPRGMTLPQYAYWYAATGGFSPWGTANYQASEARNRANEQAAFNDYRQAQSNFGAAIAEHNAHAQANNAEMGRVIAGQQTYYNPATGQNVQLQYTQPGQTWTQNGYTYRMGADGRYYATTGDGWWVPVNPAATAPR